MKIKLYYNITAWLLMVLVVVTTVRCVDEFKDPYQNLDNISLVVKGVFVEECGGVFDTIPAEGAIVTILHAPNKSGKYDTLTTVALNNQGLLQFVLPNSRGGIANIKLQASYMSYIFVDSMDFMCCDTLFVFPFNRNCDEVIDGGELSCGAIDTVYNLTLANEYGACLQLGAAPENIRKNSISFSSSDEITVDVSALLSEVNGFYANISPEPGANGLVQLGGNGASSISVSFFVQTTQAGQLSHVVNLPVTCTDGSGNVNNGNIRINLSAEVCEDACACPFSDDLNNLVNIDRSGLGVLVGTSGTFNQQSIFVIQQSMLEEGCYLKINEIGRYLSLAPISQVLPQNEAIHDWIISSVADVNRKYYAGDQFAVDALFTPDKSGYSADTFEVKLTVYNKLDEAKGDCAMLFRFNGLGCETICPQLRILSSMPVMHDILGNNSFSANLGFGDLVTFNVDQKLRQNITGTLKSLCSVGTGDDERVSYMVSIPDDADVELCNRISISLRIEDDGVAGDRNYFRGEWIDFSSSNTKSFLKGESAPVMVFFETPTTQAHINSMHDSIYFAKLVLDAKDANGNLICSQEIKLEADVRESFNRISEPMTIMAFSQVSNNQPTAAYMAYQIDSYNWLGKYYGKIDNLKPSLGHVNTLLTPHVPSQSVNHSFYFEVNNPNNGSLLQRPENLGLVNSVGNNYSNITSTPVARYSSPKEFWDNLEPLIERVFKQNNFQSVGITPATNFTFTSSNTDVLWAPYTTAQEMASDPNRRIKVSLGDVYIIWNRYGNQGSFSFSGTEYRNYCEVAFLYINGLSDGSDNSDKIGTVSFYVAYPLNVIKY